MGNLHLVTGYAGQEHVTAADHGAFNAALIGTGQFVLAKGCEFGFVAISSNQLRILDGELMMQGRFVRLDPDTYVDLTLENGAQGMRRNDLIVARYTKNTSTGVEEVNLVVIKGTAVAGDPVDPAYTVGDITNGVAVLNDFPLYRIPFDGLYYDKPERLYELFGDSMRTLPTIRQQVESIHAEVDAQLAEQDAEIDEKIAGIESYLKDEVMTDETKALYGFDSSAVPNDVFVALNTSLIEAMKYIKKCASAESGVGLTLVSDDTKVMELTNTVTFDFENTLAEGEEIVYINGLNWEETNIASSSSGATTCNATVSAVINDVKYELLSKQYKYNSTTIRFGGLHYLCDINLYAVAGITIKAGDSVAFEFSHEMVDGDGTCKRTISDVSLDVRVV